MVQKDDPGGKTKLAQMVLQSAQDIWSAGLSAVERAGQDGGEFFEQLVEEGRQIEAQLRKSADDTLENAKRSTNQNWQSIERILEDRVARTLQQLGIPTREDIQALNRQLDQIACQIAARQIPADDLKQISGIGEAIEQKLHAHGITRFQQIAQWQTADIEHLEEVVLSGRFAGRIHKDGWIQQAQALYREKYQQEP